MLEPIVIKKKKRFRRFKKALQDPYYWLVNLIMKRKGYIFITPSLSSKFYLPYVRTDFIQRYIYRKKSYFEQDNLDYICKKWKGGIIGETIRTSIVLDIGTNIGNHTLYYLNECGAKGVYCFEPIPDTFEILKKNVEINNLGNKVRMFNVAVGDISGRAIVTHYDLCNTGSTTIAQSNDGTIKMISIDDLTILDKIGLVKIDVEGFEVTVIRGLIKTIKTHRPYISIEIEDDNYEQLSALFNEYGYKPILVSKSPNYGDYLFYE